MKLRNLFAAAMVALFALVSIARATEQASFVLPTTGPMSMASFVDTYLNPAMRALASCHWGTTPPANGPSASPILFQCWGDTSASPALVKRWDGAQWAVEASYNTSTHIWTPYYQGTQTGTASLASTGSAGHTLGFLDAANTYSAIQSGATAAVDTNTTQFATTAFVLAQAASATPLIDGSAAVGTSTRYARADHVHPTDTTRAPLASPALTGTPTAPTASPGANSTQLATTAYADAIAALKANSASPALTGVPTAPTASPGANSTQLATTAYADAIAALKANLASPALTGTPTAPTAAVDTNTTQLATTGFVLGQAASATPQIDGAAAVGTSTRYARADHVHPTDTTRAPTASPALTGVVDFQGAHKDSTQSTPAQITADQNDYNPSSVVCVSTTTLLINSNAASNVTGIGGGVAGCDLYVFNNGSFPIVLKDGSASSLAANRFSFGSDLTLTAKAGVHLKYDGVGSVWRSAGAGAGGSGGGGVSSVTVAAGDAAAVSGTCSSTTIFSCTIAGDASFFQGYIAGLTLSTAGSSATFSVTAGVAVDSTSSGFMKLASSLSKTTSAWASGTGNGALDTGTIAASTWYHVFLIKNVTAPAVDVLVSLSASAPTLPSGYTLARRIGSMKTDGSSHWLSFTQIGNDFIWTTTVQDISNATQSTSAVTYTMASVPTGVVVKWKGAANFSVSSNEAGGRVTALFQADESSGSGTAGSESSNVTAGATITRITTRMDAYTNTSAQISVRSEAAVNTFNLNTIGWEDTRGAGVVSGGASPVTSTQVAPFMRSYLAGLTLSTAGSSATFSVAAGVAADSTNADVMTLASSISKTTSSWAVGTSAGALDTGTIAASTWYHVYEIKRPDSGVVDILISLSASAPTMPSGYTLKRRIGSMKTNGSSQWTSFTQLGDEFLWSSPPLDFSATSVGNGVATLLTATVPTGAQVNAMIEGYVNSTTGGAQAYFSSFDQTDIATPNGTSAIVPSGSAFGSFRINIRTNTSAQFRGRANNTITFSASTIGWIDTRGRDF